MLISFLLVYRNIFRGNWSFPHSLEKESVNGFRIFIEEPINYSGYIIYEAKANFFNESSFNSPMREFKMFGISANNNSDFYFFSTPRTIFTLSKAIALLNQTYKNIDPKNSENLLQIQKEMVSIVNHTQEEPLLASLMFSNTSTLVGYRTFDTNFGILGFLDFDRTISFAATKINYAKFLIEGKKFGVIIAISILFNFAAWRSLFCNFKSSTSLVHLSLGTFIMHISFDFSFALYFFDLTSTALEFIRLFLFLFFCTISMFIICMQLIAMIWRAQNPDADEEIRMSFMNLVIGVSTSMFLYSFSTSLVFHAPAVTLIFIYSFFIPQIIHSARIPGKKKGDETFNIFITIQRLIPLWYSTLYKANIHETYSVTLGIGITIYILFQLFIMFMQSKFGGYFFLPSKCQPSRIDYLDEPIPDNSQCPICMCDVINGDNSIMTPCHHAFHKSCLSRWLDEEMICPICRNTLPPIYN